MNIQHTKGASKPSTRRNNLIVRTSLKDFTSFTPTSFMAFGIFILLAASILMACNNSGKKSAQNGPANVELKKESNAFRLYVNGEPFYIRGAGTDTRDPSSVALHGGNAIRTWRTGSNSFTGQQVLDTALAHGLMVVMGLDVARERHGFDYDNPESVRTQLEFVKAEVTKYKDHPALLAWGIGNELNLHYSNLKVWDAVNEIALMIKEIDPNHPTTTMLAGARKADIEAVTERAPSLDFLSFQLYGSIVNLPDYLEQSSFDGAYAITEWGVTGHWEVPKTAWGRPIEENSHVKAMAYKERYEKIIAADSLKCIGSFVFLWGQKQERTPTWYGLFLESGERTETVDVMQFLWTGKWPENRAPQLKDFFINGLTAYNNVYLSVSETFEAKVMVHDPDDDALTYRWEIIPEVPVDQQSEGGDFEPRPSTCFNETSTETEMKITAPAKPGEYRLFVYVFDGNNNAATANIPFFVK